MSFTARNPENIAEGGQVVDLFDPDGAGTAAARAPRLGPEDQFVVNMAIQRHVLEPMGTKIQSAPFYQVKGQFGEHVGNLTAIYGHHLSRTPTETDQQYETRLEGLIANYVDTYEKDKTLRSLPADEKSRVIDYAEGNQPGFADSYMDYDISTRTRSLDAGFNRIAGEDQLQLSQEDLKQAKEVGRIAAELWLKQRIAQRGAANFASGRSQDEIKAHQASETGVFIRSAANEHGEIDPVYPDAAAIHVLDTYAGHQYDPKSVDATVPTEVYMETLWDEIQHVHTKSSTSSEPEPEAPVVGPAAMEAVQEPQPVAAKPLVPETVEDPADLSVEGDEVEAEYDDEETEADANKKIMLLEWADSEHYPDAPLEYRNFMKRMAELASDPGVAGTREVLHNFDHHLKDATNNAWERLENEALYFIRLYFVMAVTKLYPDSSHQELVQHIKDDELYAGLDADGPDNPHRPHDVNGNFKTILSRFKGKKQAADELTSYFNQFLTHNKKDSFTGPYILNHPSVIKYLNAFHRQTEEDAT